jgi:SAM-dependent methyltransferase
MRAQRPVGAAPCIDAHAEQLPFADGFFDAAMAVLSDHHWRDPLAGLREMRRVAQRVVVFQWDGHATARYWLVRDYLPEVTGLAAGSPGLRDRARVLGARSEPVPIPWDCIDGFFHAYWRRPHAYLDEQVRRSTSVWARVGVAAEIRAVAALGADLESGRWQERHGALLALEQAELGARLLISGERAFAARGRSRPRTPPSHC